MARLPQPGGDSGNWGTILNDYLAQSHKADGGLKNDIVTSDTIAPGAVTSSKLTATIQTSLTHADTAYTAVSGRLSTATLNATYTRATSYIIPVLGQSNAKGTNTDYDIANIDIPTPRIKVYAGSGANANQLATAVVPLAGVSIDPSGGMGPGFPFALRYLSRINETEDIVIVPVGVGSAGFLANGSVDARWKVGEAVPGRTNLYELAITQINGAVAAVEATGRQPIIPAILWHQGEADSNISASQSAYAAELDALINGLRSRITLAASAPFLVGQLAPERISTQPGTAGVNAAHIDTPRRMPLTGFAPSTTGYAGGDDTHFNAAGQRILALSYEQALDRARANLAGVIPSEPVALRIDDTGIYWQAPSGRVTSYDIVLSINGAAENTTSGLTQSQMLLPLAATDGVAVRVRARSEAGAGPWSYASRQQASAASTADPLDGITFARAYALRKIITAYSGAVMRVRRDSDNTEQDVASMGEAVAFVGSASGYIVTWYDQSGNSRDVTQATAAKQPRIINAGTMEQIGSRPAVRFDNTDDILVGSSAGAFAAGSASFAGVVHGYTGAAASSPVLSETSSSSLNPWYEIAGATSYTMTQSARNDSASTFLTAATVAETPPLFQPGVPAQFTAIDTGSVFKKRVARTNLADINYTRGTATLNRFCINGRQRNGTDGAIRGMYLGELLVAHTAWDTATRDKVEAFEASYYGL